MGGGRIECHLDVVSLFSYVAYADLIPNLDKLTANGVEVDLIPTFLGGIMQKSGNKPPWTNAVKGRYLQYDSKRSIKRAGLPPVDTPEDLFAVSNTVGVLRALHYIKANYSKDAYLSTWGYCLKRFWTAPGVNFTQDDQLKEVLTSATHLKSGKKLFTAQDVEKILAGRASMKTALTEATQTALDRGAFGAPWFWVTNRAGEAQPFFGSDRFNHIYGHLDITFQDVEVLQPKL